MKKKLPFIILIIVFIAILIASRFSNRGGSKAVYEGHQSGYTVCDYVEGVTFDVPEDCLAAATTESIMTGPDDKYLRGYWIIKNTSDEYKLFCYGKLVVFLKRGTNFLSDGKSEDIKNLISTHDLNGTWFTYDNEKFSKKSGTTKALKTIGTVVADIKINPQFYGNYAGRLAVLSTGKEEWTMFAGFKGNSYKNLSGTEKDIVCHMIASLTLNQNKSDRQAYDVETTATPEPTASLLPTPTPVEKKRILWEDVTDVYLNLKYVSKFFDDNYYYLDRFADDRNKHTTYAGQLPWDALSFSQGYGPSLGYWFLDSSACFVYNGITYGIFTYSTNNTVATILDLTEDDDALEINEEEEIQLSGGFKLQSLSGITYIVGNENALVTKIATPTDAGGEPLPVEIIELEKAARIKKDMTTGVYGIPEDEIISPVYEWLEDDYIEQFCNTSYSNAKRCNIIGYYMSNNASGSYVDEQGEMYGRISSAGYPEWILAWCKNNPDLVYIIVNNKEGEYMSMAHLDIIEPSEGPTPLLTMTPGNMNPLFVYATENSLLNPLLLSQSGKITVKGADNNDVVGAIRVDRCYTAEETKKLLKTLKGEKYEEAPVAQKWFMLEFSSTLNPEEYSILSALYGQDGDALTYNGVRNASKTHLITTEVYKDRDVTYNRFYLYYPIPNGFRDKYLIVFGGGDVKCYFLFSPAR